MMCKGCFTPGESEHEIRGFFCGSIILAEAKHFNGTGTRNFLSAVLMQVPGSAYSRGNIPKLGIDCLRYIPFSKTNSLGVN